MKWMKSDHWGLMEVTMLSRSSAVTPVTDEWFQRMEIKKRQQTTEERWWWRWRMPISFYLQVWTFVMQLRECVCARMCVCVSAHKNMKTHFVPFPIASGFFLLLVPVLSNEFPLNQFNRNVFICAVKSKRKFFDIKARMLHMNACATPSMGILLIICCCFHSIQKLFPVPFRPTYFSFFLLLLDQFVKRNEINLNW